jgi:hypothetical protein
VAVVRVPRSTVWHFRRATAIRERPILSVASARALDTRGSSQLACGFGDGTGGVRVNTPRVGFGGGLGYGRVRLQLPVSPEAKPSQKRTSPAGEPSLAVVAGDQAL